MYKQRTELAVLRVFFLLFITFINNVFLLYSADKVGTMLNSYKTLSAPLKMLYSQEKQFRVKYTLPIIIEYVRANLIQFTTTCMNIQAFI